MIFAVNKPLGVSTHAYVSTIGKKLSEKVTHTGSLDPMATGVVVVLSGADRLDKQQYSDVDKTYTFSMLVGLTTDSLDLLGLVSSCTEQEFCNMDVAMVEKVSLGFVGEYIQQLPAFCARRTNGESFFDISKRGEVVPIVYEHTLIKQLSLIRVWDINTEELLERIERHIIYVEGDFRQDEIIVRWRETMSKLGHHKFQVFDVTVVSSKRMYVRGLVRDISAKLEIPCTTIAIERTQNGRFSIDDCVAVF